jgi:hypothetical protein
MIITLQDLPFSLGIPLEGLTVMWILDHDDWKNMVEQAVGINP